MSVGWTRRSEYGELTDLEERLGGPQGSEGRPASLMDALHDRITQVFDLTRSELRVHAAVLDELVEQTQRVETRLAELLERVDSVTRLEDALRRVEGRLSAHAAAVEGELERLMVWLDAPATVTLVDLRDDGGAGAGGPGANGAAGEGPGAGGGEGD